MGYKYGYRHVAFLKTQDDVEKELQLIYDLNDDGRDIMSLQVIPRYRETDSLPFRYEISYVYRYKDYDGNNDL